MRRGRVVSLLPPLALALAVGLVGPPRLNSVSAEPAPARGVASIAAGVRDFYAITDDGALWTISRHGGRHFRSTRVETNGAVRSVAETGPWLWTLDTDGHLSRRVADARRDSPMRAALAALGPFKAVAGMNIGEGEPRRCEQEQCDYETYASALVLLNERGEVWVRTIARWWLPERDLSMKLAVPSPVRAIATTEMWGCATTTAGAVWCFAHPAFTVEGWLFRSRLSPACMSDWNSLPAARIPLPAAASSVFMSGENACARLESGRVWCWRTALYDPDAEEEGASEAPWRVEAEDAQPAREVCEHALSAVPVVPEAGRAPPRDAPRRAEEPAFHGAVELASSFMTSGAVCVRSDDHRLRCSARGEGWADLTDALASPRRMASRR